MSQSKKLVNKSQNVLRRTSTLTSSILFSDEIIKKPLNGRKTKIVCTIGPASKDVAKLEEMLHAGMNVARLNFSHGTHDYHRETIANIRSAVKNTCIHCAILLDTKGPEIRTGLLENGEPVMLQQNQEIEIVCGKNIEGNSKKICVDYANMVHVVSVGTIIKIDDGLIEIEVIKVKGDTISGLVLNGQELGQQKGVNLPGIETGLPALTEKDIKDLRFGVEQKIDFLAPSFINSDEDVKQIRKILGDDGAYIKVISKIESFQGLVNFDRILKESDGIMVARGDLGVEIPIQKVCIFQKTIINKCNSAGKPVVTATQMLDSMIKNPRPTRAEATDVANAVFDGTDCVMLSGETAKGSYPVESVKIMAEIARTSERALDREALFYHLLSKSVPSESAEDIRTEAVSSAAVKMAIDLKASIIIALTDTGRTPSFISKYRPPVTIIAVTPYEVVAHQSLIQSGVWPILVNKELNDSQRFDEAIKIAKKNGWCTSGDVILAVSGKYGESGSSFQPRVIDLE